MKTLTINQAIKMLRSKKGGGRKETIIDIKFTAGIIQTESFLTFLNVVKKASEMEPIKKGAIKDLQIFVETEMEENEDFNF